VLHEGGLEGFHAVCRTLLDRDLAAVGDRVLFTEGHDPGVAGGTNTMKNLEVIAPD
jgi:hypothetical protein